MPLQTFRASDQVKSKHQSTETVPTAGNPDDAFSKNPPPFERLLCVSLSLQLWHFQTGPDFMTHSLTQLPRRQQSVCKVNVPKRKQTREGGKKPDDEAENPAVLEESEARRRRDSCFRFARLYQSQARRKSANRESSQRRSVCCGRPGIRTSGGSGVGEGEGKGPYI